MKNPELFEGYIEKLIEFNDDLPSVLWHLSLLFANLNYSPYEKTEIISTLFYLLDDKSVFVKHGLSSLTF